MVNPFPFTSSESINTPVALQSTSAGASITLPLSRVFNFTVILVDFLDVFGIRWIAGFSKMIGHCQASVAEEWAIMEGLCLAWELDIKNLELECDADEVVRSILEDRQGVESLMTL